MRTRLLPCFGMALLAWTCAAQENQANDVEKAGAAKVTAHSDGLHGYIGFSATRPPARSEYSAGMGFYSAVWPLIDQPLADFQIGLAGSWITPDNSDNKDKPLAPEGTLARTWQERGPTWEQRLPNRGRRAGLLGGQPLPLRPAEVQHERHAAMLRLRGRIAGLVLLLQQRSAAGQSPGHRPTEQPAADSSRCAAVPGKSQRPVPGLHLDGLALYRSHHGRPAHGRPELDLLPERGQLQGADRLLHSGDLEQDRQAVQLSVHLWTRARRPAGRHGRRRHGDQHRAAFRGPGRARGGLFEDPQAAVPGGRPGENASWCRT